MFVRRAGEMLSFCVNNVIHSAGVRHSLFVLLKCEGAWGVSSALFPLFADGNGDFGGGGEADFVPE